MARHCHARLAQSQPTRPTAAHTHDVCRLRSHAASREARRSTLAQARGRRAGAAWLSTVATRGGVVANGTCKSHFVHWFSAPVRQQQHPSRPRHACPVSFALHFRTALPRLLCQNSRPRAQTLQSWTSDRQWPRAPRCLRRAARPQRNCAFQGTMSRTTAEQIIWTDRDCAPDRMQADRD